MTKLQFTCNDIETVASTVNFLKRWGFKVVEQEINIEVEVVVNQPYTTKQWVLHLLSSLGPKDTLTLWKLLADKGKGPRSPHQLSAVLSRLKKAGQVGRNKQLWFSTSQALANSVTSI